MKSKKENFVAWSRFIPENNAEEIVIPLLEIPGKSPSICENPIEIELEKFNLE